MRRLGEVRWRTGSPSSIDEELVLYDDGSAWLVVRRPRQSAHLVGSYAVEATAASEPEACAAVAALGRPLVVDLLDPPRDGVAAATFTAAEQLAARCRAEPLRTVEWYARLLGPVDDSRRRLALGAVGRGRQAVEFELDPAGSGVSWLDGDQPIAWSELPVPPVGFVTPEGVGLGGVGRAGRIEPGHFGVVALDLAVPEAATGLFVQVAGWLRATLPDDSLAVPFQARTERTER